LSLFGNGRGDGFAAALALVVLAFVVHASATVLGLGHEMVGNQPLAAAMGRAHALIAAGELPLWDAAGVGAPIWSTGAELLYPPWWLLGRGADEYWLSTLTGLHAGLACALAFRLLRAQGRSRYAAFVGGAAYGLGSFAASLHGNLTEMAALAWAPLSVEVLLRVVRGERHRRRIVLLGPALAIPFLTGGTVTASLAVALVTLWLLRRAMAEPARRAHLLTTGAGSLLITALLTAPLWLAVLDAPTQPQLPAPTLDWVVPRQRLAGPLLVFLALLGLLRRQREAPPARWLTGLAFGALVAVLMPYVPSPLPGPAPWQVAPMALWWPVHLALVLFATSGLDDFLDLPSRRPGATAWAMLLAIAIAPVSWWFASREQFLLVEAAGLLTFAALFGVWRRLGMLGFKTALASAALAWLTISTLHEHAQAPREPVTMPTVSPPDWQLPAAPAGEFMPARTSATDARIAYRLHTASPAAQTAGTAAATDLPTQPSRRASPLSSAAITDLPPDFVSADSSQESQVVVHSEGSSWGVFEVDLHAGRGALIWPARYARGWHAQVDDRPVPVHRADGWARAVLLDAGPHLVRFDYRPLALTLGGELAACGCILWVFWVLLTMLVWSVRRRW